MTITTVEQRSHDGSLLYFTDVYVDGVYAGYVDSDRKRVTISGDNGAWCEVQLACKRPTVKSAWLAARKVFPNKPTIRRVGLQEHFGQHVNETPGDSHQ